MCYVMGGAELQLLDEYLGEEFNESVEIRTVPCLDKCTKEGGKAPFAMVGDTVVNRADVGKVKAEIISQLAEQTKKVD